MKASFDIVLKEKAFEYGLVKSEIVDLLDMCSNPEVYPIELEAREHECAAMGFISVEAADQLDFDYEASGLHDFIANILDDMENENESCIYEFKDLQIYLSR